MMELTCACILLSAGLVLASPHGYGGYGVKGGASTTAEANASAGAFGGAPIPVPLGASYSGSFSKSSSSSSASSSASSSSSSFSYSGSGSGGIGLNSGIPNHGGCSAGNCHNAKSNDIPTSHGSFPQAHNSANAAASAQAGAVSGLGCQGLGCGADSEKCKSGQCESKLHTGTTSINSDTNKCTSGRCGTVLENGATPANHDSNDIRAVSHSSDSAQLLGIDKSASVYDAGSDCSHGKCGHLGSSNSKPNDYGHNLENSYQGSSAFNKQQASSSDTGINSQYQKPSPHLETPKLSSKCYSGNCYAGPAEPGHETAPSSYNVPIHGAYEKPDPKPTCDGVKCENHPKGPYSPTENTVTKGSSSFDYPSSLNCVGSSCFGKPTNQAAATPSSNINFGHSPSNVPTSNGCNSPNCSPLTTNPAGPIVAPGHIGYGNPSDVNKPTNDKLPVYTGGFGGPAGILNPNKYDVSAPTGNPSHHHASTQNGKPLEGAPTGCNSPSCSGYPSTSQPTGGSKPEGTYNFRPGGDIPNDKLPTYTGGFGGPAGTLKPNELVHGTVTDEPNFGHTGIPSYNTQPQAINIGTPACKLGESCGGYTPTAGATSVATAPSGYYGTTKPNTAIHSNDGFGGPGVILDSDKNYNHAAGPSSSGYTPAQSLNTPTFTGHSEGCKTSNCYSPFGSADVPHQPAQPFGVTKPSLNPHLPSVTSPAFTSNYNEPSEVHRPTSIRPTSNTGLNHPQQPYSPGIYSTGCETGNCANYPTSGLSAGTNVQSGSFGVTKPNTNENTAPTHPQYTGGFGGAPGAFRPNEPTYVTPSIGSAPTNCRTPNCVGSPSASADATSGASAQSGSSGVTKPSDANNPTNEKPIYSGGFGGAAGLLKPNEFIIPTVVPKPNTKPTGATNSACASGNCDTQPLHSSAPHSNVLSGAHATATAAASAMADAVAYSGGFGGPPGVLAPYDEGKIGTLPTGGIHAHGPQKNDAYAPQNADIHSLHGTIPIATGGSSGHAGSHENTGAQAGSSTGSTAYAGAAASASAGAHGYNPHGSQYNHGGKGGSPCSGGCSASGSYNGDSTSHGPNRGGSSSGASAKSLSGANAFGVGGSFASSSASAHASAGAYTKGGYGKR